MREVHTIAPAFTIGLWGLSVEKQNLFVGLQLTIIFIVD